MFRPKAGQFDTKELTVLRKSTDLPSCDGKGWEEFTGESSAICCATAAGIPATGGATAGAFPATGCAGNWVVGESETLAGEGEEPGIAAAFKMATGEEKLVNIHDQNKWSTMGLYSIKMSRLYDKY